MKTASAAAVIVVLALAGQVWGEQVRFQGVVSVAEAHDVIPVCYGEYHVTVVITAVLEDPNSVLGDKDSVRVCYQVEKNLVLGEAVEVYGSYCDYTCGKQYTGSVRIKEISDFIRRVACTDDDWMVDGDLMYSIPSGNVGIGTSRPAEKLHVLGTALVQGQSSGMWDEALRVVKEGTGRQLAACFCNPSNANDAAVDVQLGGGTSIPWAWSLQAGNGTLTIGYTGNLPVLYLRNTGNVGLGVASPEYRLDLPNTAGVAGRGRANRWDTYSSQRWKTNIRTIDHAMDKVRELRGVYFDWKDQGTRDLGMIAEEVGKVVPEIVSYEANGADASTMAYDRLVAVLVEALKEQDARIAELEQTVAQNKRLEQRLATLERLIQERQAPSVAGPLRP